MIQCGNCFTRKYSSTDSGGYCQKPGCSLFICGVCYSSGRYCYLHAKESKGGPNTRSVFSDEIKKRERLTLVSFDEQVRRLTYVINPPNDECLNINDWEWFHSNRDQRYGLIDLLGQQPKRSALNSLDDSILSVFPTNPSSLYYLPPTSKSHGMIFEALALSDLRQIIKEGAVTPLGKEPLEQLLNDRAEIVGRTKGTYVLLVVSTSGWQDSIREFLREKPLPQSLFVCLWDFYGYPVHLKPSKDWLKYFEFILPSNPTESALRYSIMKLLDVDQHASRREICHATDLPDDIVGGAFRLLIGWGKRKKYVTGDEDRLDPLNLGAINDLLKPEVWSSAWKLPPRGLGDVKSAKVNCRLSRSNAPLEFIPKGECVLRTGQVKSVAPFLMSWYPVTNAEFKEFVDDTSYKTEAERHGSFIAKTRYEPSDADWKHLPGPRGSIRDRMDHPVVHVTLKDAQKFCEWASKRLGARIRLPSEEEWIRAARGKREFLFPWGPGLKEDCCNTQTENMKHTTTAVRQYPRGVSVMGIWDMAGNVSEWVNTKRGTNYIAKGGSWAHPYEEAQCIKFEEFPQSFSANNLGFRYVREV